MTMTPKEFEERAKRLRQFNDFSVTAREVAQFLDDAAKIVREETLKRGREVTVLTTVIGTLLDEMESASRQLWPDPVPLVQHDVSMELEEAVARARRSIKILAESLSDSVEEASTWHKRYEKLAKAADFHGGPCLICNSSHHRSSGHEWK